AMACGIPVLATNVGGTAELLGPLGDGCLLPAGIDAADLASAIQSEILDLADHAYRALSERTVQQWEQIASAEAIYTSFSEEVRALARHS
ncbi:glycosyltransferase, partial [Klebsiella pneumoniae]|uniref:glycosyltransferase n=1 Tax=Klebsiella pneumoniae TaxID=573 RepID=UPI003FCFE4A4